MQNDIIIIGLAYLNCIQFHPNISEFHLLPGPSMKYITIGGLIDMYFFLGPTPDQTVQQFTEVS